MTAMKNKITVFILVVTVMFTLLPLSGCLDDTWEGEWNRTGDSTFNRGVVTISDYTSDGFTFSLKVYNGNIAGSITNAKAIFTNNENTEAKYFIPDGYGAHLLFSLDEESEDLDIIFTSAEYTEMDILGFASGGYITGRYEKGDVEYLNYSLYDMGIIEKSYDDQLRSMMSKDNYTRLLDCYQSYEVKRNNEIGGFIYYGSNSMQTHTAAMICFDDGTVSVVISRESESMLYFTNNKIYDTSMLAYPLDNWIDEYELEKEKQNASTVVLP